MGNKSLVVVFNYIRDRFLVVSGDRVLFWRLFPMAVPDMTDIVVPQSMRILSNIRVFILHLTRKTVIDAKVFF